MTFIMIQPGVENILNQNRDYEAGQKWTDWKHNSETERVGLVALSGVKDEGEKKSRADTWYLIWTSERLGGIIL